MRWGRQGFGETPHHQLWVKEVWGHHPSPRRPHGNYACVSGEQSNYTKEHIDVKMCDRAREKTCSIMWAFYLLRSSSRVHRYGADKLWRNAADRGADQDIRSWTIIRAILVLALTGDASAGQNCRLIQRPRTGLHT